MSDHLPEDLVRAEEVDVLLEAICESPCKIRDVASGCACAMLQAIVANLRATAEAARRSAVGEMVQICRDQQQGYFSTKYAINQPMSSIGERFACGQMIEALERMIDTPSPTDLAALKEAVVEAAMMTYRVGLFGKDTIKELSDACAALAAQREESAS